MRPPDRRWIRGATVKAKGNKENGGDQIRKKLFDQWKGGIEFLKPHDDVLSGKTSLWETTNQSSGSNVYVAGHPLERPREELLRTGKMIGPGAVEKIRSFELRCHAIGRKLVVRLYRGSESASIALEYEPPGGPDKECDEGLFTWFGPVEDICTPWSDNDPSQCQVVAVDDLRRFAQKNGRQGKTGK